MWKFLRGGATVIPGATFIPESRVVPVKSKVKISLNCVAFSEYIYELYFVHFFEDEDTYPLTFSYLCVRLPDWNCCYKKDMYIPYIAKKFRF